MSFSNRPDLHPPTPPSKGLPVESRGGSRDRPHLSSQRSHINGCTCSRGPQQKCTVKCSHLSSVTGLPQLTQTISQTLPFRWTFQTELMHIWRHAAELWRGKTGTSAYLRSYSRTAVASEKFLILGRPGAVNLTRLVFVGEDGFGAAVISQCSNAVIGYEKSQTLIF